MSDDNFDPITFNHWLAFKNRCLEGSPQDFQALFEAVMKRARPEFMQIKPYGKIGDRKCDGLLRGDGIVFQVYSPDQLKLADLRQKIDEDLGGAVGHWGDTMQKWVFVYNTRRGLAPDVPAILNEKQKRYPKIKIDHLSDDALWEITRYELTVQQRAEILGAPAQGLVMNSSISEAEIKSQIQRGWTVLVQDVMSPINLASVEEALQPDIPFGLPILIRPEMPLDWSKAIEYQRIIVKEAIEKARNVEPRFAVFSLAPIPLVAHLGFLLSDRVEVRPFQYQRDLSSWQWPDKQEDRDTVKVTGFLVSRIADSGEAVIRISLSSHIDPADSLAVVNNPAVEVDVFVDRPDLLWLRSSQQFIDFGNAVRSVFANLRSYLPKCQCIHVFYAGPTGGAIVLGQQVNLRMNPPVVTYEYARQKSPRYQKAITLDESSG